MGKFLHVVNNSIVDFVTYKNREIELHYNYKKLFKKVLLLPHQTGSESQF